MKARVKLTSAILDAVEETSDMFINKRPWLYKMAVRGFKNIKSQYQYKKAIHVLDVIDNRLVTCTDPIVDVLDFIPGDYGIDCWNMFKSRYCQKRDIPYIESQAQWIGSSTVQNDLMGGSYDYRLEDNQIIFDTPINTTKITVLTADLDIDLNNEIWIPEECVEAVSLYLQVKLVTLDLRAAIRRRETNYIATNNLQDLKREHRNIVLRTRGRLANNQESESQQFLTYFSG